MPDHSAPTNPANDATALPPSIAPTTTPPPNQTPPAPAPPTSTRQIGPYHILEVLGDGGMGTVYKAEQRHPLKRIVAEVIKPGFDTQEVIARFESERQALARMDHPHIAKVFDAGTTDLGRPYFVMEYVPGIPITKFADEHKLTIRQRLQLFLQVCQAIAHAHSKALIHRDIKPGNVLAYLSDGQPRAMVIDFGIAKALSGEKLVEATLTSSSGIAIGTPYSMSPEQAEGSPDIDTRTDVYSLGVLLYELLTGRKPFEPRDLAKLALSEVLRIIREVDPPRPSDAFTRMTAAGPESTTIAESRHTRLHTLSRELRRELEWIPMKAMRKERNRRYASPLTLAEDVENYLAGRPLAAGPESRIYRLRKFSKRNRTALTTAAVFAALLIGGTIFYIHSIRTEQQKTLLALQETEKERAEKEVQATLAAQRAESEAKARKEAEDSAAVAEAVGAFQNDMLTRADPDQLLGDKVTVLQAMQAAVKELDDGKLKDQPLVEAAVRERIGNTLRSLARYDEAEPNLRRAVEVLRSSLPAGDADIARSLGLLVGMLLEQSRLDEAEPLAREALGIHRAALAPGDPAIFTSLNNLAIVLNRLNKRAEAESLFREALAVLRRAQPTDLPRLATCQSNLANLLAYENKLPEAEQLLREALEIRRSLFPEGHPEIATVLTNLGGVLVNQKKPAEAEPLLREALAIDRKTLPAGHPSIAGSLNSLARVAMDLDRPAEAEILLRESLQIRRAVLPPKHPNIANSLNGLAVVLARQQKFADAEAVQREALEIFRAALPPGHPAIAQGINNLASTLDLLGKTAEAEQLYREALDIRRAGLPAGHPDTIRSLNNLAGNLDAQNRQPEAESLLREAVAMRRATTPPDDSDIATALTNLALNLKDQNKPAEAEPVAREALTLDKKAFGPTHTLTCRTAFYLAEILEAQNKLAEAATLRTQYRLGDPTTRPAS